MPAGLPATGSFFNVPSIACPAVLLAAFLFTGCSSEEPILVELVPKEAPPETLEPRPIERTDRMLAAIIPRGESAIFFKVTGPEQLVSQHKPEFLSLVQSVSFENDQPNWTLPAGWTQEPGSGERLATITVPADEPLELTVTSLPMRDEDREYRLSNVNRWRAQMGLRPMQAKDLHAGGDLNEETVALTLDDGTEVTLVNIAGRFQGGMTPPFASGTRTGGSSPRPTTARPSPLTYETPAGWREVGVEGISLATFTVDEVKTTVTPLSARANTLIDNVNRWREQVDLPKIREDQLGEAVETIRLGDGERGDYVVLIGPQGASQQAILGVVAVRGDTAWFVKMMGQAETVQREQHNFESFVRSLRFPESP